MRPPKGANRIKSCRNRVLRASLVLFAVVLVVAGFFLSRVLAIGAAYKAKILCSGVFVSGRDPESLLSEDLGLAPFKLIGAKIDREGRSVTCTAMGGLVRRKAVCRPVLGAVLLNGVHDIRSLYLWVNFAFPMPPADQASLPWPTGDVLSSDPSVPGIDTEKLALALDEAFSEPNPRLPRRTRAMVVVYDGRIVAERYAPGFTQDTRLTGWSMTKSVTSALVGILVGQGKLSLDAPAPVPEWKKPGDPRGAITLNHLLQMASGLSFQEVYENPLSDVCVMLFRCKDAAGLAASKPLEAAPGTRWYYSSGTANIVSRIVRDAFGGNMDEYYSFPRTALFNKIGMRSAIMETDPSGTFVGSSFMYATARDWARFGLLYLQDGVWEGERILPEGWVEYTSRPSEVSSGRYGAHWHMMGIQAIDPATGVRGPVNPVPIEASGFEGQSVLVIPSHKTVIVRLGDSLLPGAWDIGPFASAVLDAMPK